MRKFIRVALLLGALAVAGFGASFAAHLPYDKPLFDSAAVFAEMVPAVSR